MQLGERAISRLSAAVDRIAGTAHWDLRLLEAALAMNAARAHVQGGFAYQTSAAATLRTGLLQAGTFQIVNPRDYMGRIKASAVFDLSAGIDWQRFNVEAFATNLFDDRNELSRGVSCGSCFRPLVVVGTPRTIGLRAGTKFQRRANRSPDGSYVEAE